MSELKLKKLTSTNLSTIDRSTISSRKKLIKHKKSKSIESKENFIPYYKGFLKNNPNNKHIIIKRKEYHIPFCYEEKRFIWQNLNNIKIVDYNEKRNSKKRIYIKGNLEGGFINFLLKNKNNNTILNEINEFKDLLKNQKKKIENKNFGLKSCRVIIPENNYDKEDYYFKPQKKILKKNINILNSTGSMESLFNRTELTPPIRGRKKIEQKSINLFSVDYNIMKFPKKNYRKSNHRNYFDHISFSFQNNNIPIQRSISANDNYINYNRNQILEYNNIGKKNQNSEN